MIYAIMIQIRFKTQATAVDINNMLFKNNIDSHLNRQLIVFKIMCHFQVGKKFNFSLNLDSKKIQKMWSRLIPLQMSSRLLPKVFLNKP
jgi:hypothetical protein